MRFLLAPGDFKRFGTTFFFAVLELLSPLGPQLLRAEEAKTPERVVWQVTPQPLLHNWLDLPDWVSISLGY
ncbi:MAG: hypothetical protein WBI13_10015, partial [Synechococcus sp.]